jgi:hypothetical protein
MKGCMDYKDYDLTALTEFARRGLQVDLEFYGYGFYGGDFGRHVKPLP